MPLPLPNPDDPSNPGLSAPLFADVDAVRGDQLRALCQLIWVNFDEIETEFDASAKAAALAAVLTGYASGSDAAITAADTILAAFGKAQGQITPAKAAIAALKNIVRTEKTSATQYSSTIPFDNSIPQSGEGSEIFTATITPTNASNYIRVRAVLQFSADQSSYTIVQATLFKDSGANALQAVKMYNGNNVNYDGQLVIDYRELAGNTTARTYKIRMGSAGGEAFTVSGRANADIYGGVNVSSLTVSEEIV